MDELAAALQEAGGVAAPPGRAAQLRALLAPELARSARELHLTRSGYPDPVTVVVATDPARRALLALLPVDPALRADPAAAPERAWLLVAAVVGALHEAGAGGDPRVGHLGDDLVLHLAIPPGSADADAELAALAAEEQLSTIDRLRARALAVAPGVLGDVADLRPPIGDAHPLRVAAAIAALGGRPADPASVDRHEDEVLAQLTRHAARDDGPRPHDDPDPARRAARRILQRLHGMGKWGGYHTEFVHLTRGFAPAERELAGRVGEALVDAGLLREKTSVGQRHVFLDPRHAAQIHALIERGELPAALALPSR